MENKDSKKERYLQNRKSLIELSKGARLLVQLEEYSTVNEALIDLYKKENTEINEFKTFWQWKAEGYTIKKGVKSFLVWGQPRQITQVPEDTEEPGEFKYWPLCYLFANTQVIKPEKLKQTQPEPEEITEPLPI